MRIDLNANLLPSDGTQSVKAGARSEGPAGASTSAADSAESSTQSLSAAALTAAVGQVQRYGKKRSLPWRSRCETAPMRFRHGKRRTLCLRRCELPRTVHSVRGPSGVALHPLGLERTKVETRILPFGSRPRTAALPSAGVSGLARERPHSRIALRPGRVDPANRSST